MKVTAQKIADLIGGRVEGTPGAVITHLAKIEDAGPGSITFLANPKYTHYLYETKASAVVVNEDFKPEKKVDATLIRVNDAYKAFSDILEFFHQDFPQKTGIESPSFIHPTARIGKNVYIGAFAYIDEQVVIGDNVKIFPHVYVGAESQIGENTILYPGVKLYHQTVIGRHCIIHAGAVIGSDGFGFAPDRENYKKIPQIGNVVIGDNVEIGANSTIDRATMGSTVIRDGVKLDNQVQVAHNVEIGENTVIAAQTGISGSTKVGRNCQVGGQVGMAGHIRIGNNVRVGAQSGIVNDVPDNEVLIGSPAINAQLFRKASVLFKKLPQLYEDIKQIKRKLGLK
jgi:UDP-3-O-[3-hydroxymyristoyl] glucosamine N-acyltransferase